jgi:hypothetical protein
MWDSKYETAPAFAATAAECSLSASRTSLLSFDPQVDKSYPFHNYHRLKAHLNSSERSVKLVVVKLLTPCTSTQCFRVYGDAVGIPGIGFRALA